jgi:putative transposase
VAALLVSNFKVVLVPRLSYHQLARTGTLSSRTVRMLQSMRHCAFVDVLRQQAASSQSGCIVLEVSEAWTSKTCSRCGHLHHELGAATQFHCPHCDFTASRDGNGAKNIWLRFVMTSLYAAVEAGADNQGTSNRCV